MLKNLHQLNQVSFKYLLLGSNGLLGNQLKKILPPSKTFLVARNKSQHNFNFEDFIELRNVFKKFKFKYVINCAAITNLDYCEKNYKKIKKINTHLPKKLINFSNEYNFKLIQISTDQLFFNKTNKLNKENNKLIAINKYSKSKILAENYIKKNKNYLIIRTNFTGFKKDIKSTFVGWLYNSINKKIKINLYNDMYVSTLDVKNCALNIKKLIDINATGIFNLAANKAISKKDFALYFAKKLKKKIYFEEISVTSDYKKIKRARYLGLDVKKIQKKLKIKMISPYKAIDNLIKQKLNKN
jgi:dTDP-4-dehydrorhamnose reductase